VRVHLLHPDRDLDVDGEFPSHVATVAHDLDVDTLCAAMAPDDDHQREVARRVLLTSLTDPATVAYRQQALRDALDQPGPVRDLHELARDVLAREKRVYLGFGANPSSIVHRSVQVLEIMLDGLRGLRRLADRAADGFGSGAFGRFFAGVRDELDRDFFAAADDHLDRLRLPHGVVIGVRLGPRGRGTGHVLREPPLRSTWLRRVIPTSSQHTIEIAEVDRASTEALSTLREEALANVAEVLDQTREDLHTLFATLRREVGFYVGCLRLHRRLVAEGGAVCFPETVTDGGTTFVASGLYDVGLHLRSGGGVVGNDVDADDRALVMVTGANQGGKTTFLRSVGLAQLMTQCGMFVPAERLRTGIATQLFTHFRRGEDASMRSGKLDEELARLSRIVDELRPGALVLFNESFASTNEREGSQIAQEVVHALLDAGVRVVFVTHLYDLAAGVAEVSAERTRFLRAERREGGERTYRLLEGAPLPTSHGEDLYEQVFGSGSLTSPAATATGEAREAEDGGT
jgi:hypothetical protein